MWLGTCCVSPLKFRDPRVPRSSANGDFHHDLRNWQPRTLGRGQVVGHAPMDSRGNLDCPNFSQLCKDFGTWSEVGKISSLIDRVPTSPKRRIPSIEVPICFCFFLPCCLRPLFLHVLPVDGLQREELPRQWLPRWSVSNWRKWSRAAAHRSRTCLWPEDLGEILPVTRGKHLEVRRYRYKSCTTCWKKSSHVISKFIS